MQENKAVPETIKPQYSNAMPVWHMVLLSVATFGIYQIYWFYKNWKQLKEHHNLDTKPGWRTAGLIVPIWGLVLTYRQFDDIRGYAQISGVQKLFMSGWLFIQYLILTALWRLPDPYWLLSLFSIAPLTIIQETLNEYWKIEQPEHSTRTDFTGGQIIWLVIGGIFFIVTLVGLFAGE